MTTMKFKFTLVVFLVFAGLSFVRGQGSLWGVTSSGVADNKGVIYNTDINGANYAVSYPFNSDFPGSIPFNSLTLAGGKFYGMTSAGGAHDLGVIFEFDPATSTYTKKFDFTGTVGGASPQGGFVLAA